MYVYFFADESVCGWYLLAGLRMATHFPSNYPSQRNPVGGFESYPDWPRSDACFPPSPHVDIHRAAAGAAGQAWTINIPVSSFVDPSGEKGDASKIIDLYPFFWKFLPDELLVKGYLSNYVKKNSIHLAGQSLKKKNRSNHLKFANDIIELCFSIIILWNHVYENLN